MAYVFIDRVLECEPGTRVVAIKALAYNEEFFRDHFPGMPVVPGAMVLEGFVQAARYCLAAEVARVLVYPSFPESPKTAASVSRKVVFPLRPLP